MIKGFFNGMIGDDVSRHIVGADDYAMRAPRQKKVSPRMLSLIFLGTSASVPSVDRNHPSLLIEAAATALWSILERAHSAKTTPQRRWLPQARSDPADAWPFRSCAGNTRSVLDPQAAPEP